MNFTSHTSDAAIPLESVLCTGELNTRPSRPPGYHTECDALAELTAVLTDSPQAILQRLVDIVLKICQAGSSGVSLLSEKDNGKTCRWAAVSGAWRHYAGCEIPRDDGPCSVALARDAPQLFKHPERHFRRLSSITPAVEEVLLIPFHVRGKAVGTVWVMSHDGGRRFDSEDLRLISRLSKFAAGAYQMQETVGALQQQGSELRESRERYRTLFESIDEGFCIIQMIFDENDNPADYRFLQTNPAFERETGLENALGKTMREMIPEHDDHWFEIYGRVAITGEAVRFENYSQSLRRWFSVFAFPISDHESRQVGLIFSNITERKRSEQAVKYHNKEIEVLLNAAPIGVYLVDADFRIRA
ncbi:MAG TPA: GAF domain-containing protein, partial [Gammaproteobacteria bacterium]